jgi:hypothetical protein
MRIHINKFLLILAVSWLFRLLYLAMFHDRYSYDLVTWAWVGGVMMNGENPYHSALLDWPPLWMQLIYVFEKISRFTDWPFRDVIRGFLILTESALAGLLYAALVRFTKARDPVKLLIVGLAVNPIAILQVCQHGNFDVLVGFWVLLAVFMLLQFQEQPEARFWLCACLAVGMGALTKTVPLCLAPLLLLSARKLRWLELFLGAVLLLGPVLLGMSIIYVLTPEDVTTKVLEYRSQGGHFGFTGLFGIFGAQRLADLWPQIFEMVYGVGWLALGGWLWRRETLGKLEIVSLAGGLLLGICALGPGYGLQYIYWFMPLLLLQYELAERRGRIFLGALYAVATVTYLILYAMNTVAYGAFLLDLTRNETLVRLGDEISTPAVETLICLPLWILYCWYVAGVARQTGRAMRRDFKAWRRPA